MIASFDLLSAACRWEAPDQNFVGHRDIMMRSMARYDFVAPRVHGAALDVGCGRGYGFQFIRPASTWQVGVDISYDFALEARTNFPQVPLVCASGQRLPFASRSFDSILAFEVIEHVKDDQAFLRELRSMARDSALIAISTPNRRSTSGNAKKPLTSFHVREYTSDEFHDLLSQTFDKFTIFGQHERTENMTRANKLIDRIPVRWKYLLPVHIQSLISVALRPPLQLRECRFETQDLDNAHTFVALCSL